MPSLTRSTSKHKRNSSSHSLGHSSHPSPSAQFEEEKFDMLTWQFQAAAFIRLFSILSASLPLPSEYVRPAIQSLLFILGSVAHPLPPVGSSESPDPRPPRSFGELTDSDETSDALESSSWGLILDLLSGSYSATAVHEIRLNLLSPETRGFSGPHGSDARKARGAARALRLALRQGSQHRLALSRNEDVEDFTVYPLITSSEMGWLRRFGGIASSAVDPTLGLFGQVIRAWLGVVVSTHNRGAEAAVIECIGVANDVLDECNAADRLVSDDEAHILGDILREAVQCFRVQYVFRSKAILPFFDPGSPR